jgi:short-subunit dehydrogenase
VQLTGSRVLVTGATSGIGAATARALATRGATLLLHGRNASALHAIGDELGAACRIAELAHTAEVRDLAEWAEHGGGVDVLIGNAGAGYAGELATMPLETIETLVAVNVTANLLLARSLLPGMLSRGRGTLVFVGSVAGAMGVPREVAYSATKAAVHTLGESLRGEVAGTGVRVSVFVPGVVDTPFFSRRGTPYERGWPRAIPVDLAAHALVRAVASDRVETFAPRWLRFPARLRGGMPRLVEKAQRLVG